MSSSRIIYIDAYDSFSNNIIALLNQSTTITVIKVDQTVPNLESILVNSAAIVIGPGPGHPENFKDIGLIPTVLHTATIHAIPLLGICLGFQALCSSNGLPIIQLPIPCHGHAKEVLHSDSDIFHNVGPVLATCYNSLGVLATKLKSTTLSSRPCSSESSDCDSTDSSSISSRDSKDTVNDLIPLAQDNAGYLMAVRHSTLPQWGLQFHPESCRSSTTCHQIVKNWWAVASSWNDNSRRRRVDVSSPLEADQLLVAHGDSTSQALQDLLQLTASVGSVLDSEMLNREVRADDIITLCGKTSLTGQRVILESTKKGRYSIYAIPSASTFILEHRRNELSARINRDGTAKWTLASLQALQLVEQLISRRKVMAGKDMVHDGAPSPFWGGFLGYLSYEIGLDLLEVNHTSRPSTPNLALLWTERSVIVDHVNHTTTIQSIRRGDSQWLDFAAKKLKNPGTSIADSQTFQKLQEALRRSSYLPPDESEYLSKISSCLRHLRAGNSYELCLTTEAQMRLPTGEDLSYPLYQNLRRCNPVPFAAYIALGSTKIISSSPEQFLTWDRTGNVDMIPMKGTVRKTPSMTLARASSILASPKEQAENLMIADLIRHDLHSALGPHAAVSVEKLCAVVEHETVYQLVSHIHAEVPISPHSSTEVEQDVAIHYGHRVLRHALPPGSMTGAPKKRSCEILSQLEQRERGVYSGVIGYFDVGGGGGWSVCIRSAFTNTEEDVGGVQTWRIGAGGAITVLSDPKAEWEEMQTKLQSVVAAFRPEEDWEARG